MYNKIIYGFGVIGLLFVVFSIQNKIDQNSFKKTKSNIEEIKSEKKRLFEMVDKTMVEIEIKKQKRQQEINHLDSVLKISKFELEKSSLLIEKNKRKSDSLMSLVKEYEKLKYYLDKQIKEKNEQINTVIKERDDYKSRYDYVCENNKPVYVIDTVFIYDTTSTIITKRKNRGRN
jgi:chromosome segregation ATPase